MEHEDDGDTNCYWCTRNNPQRIGKETGRLGIKTTHGDHPNYSIIKIAQNTEKGLGDLRLAVIQTPVENHQLMVMRKTLKGVLIIIIIIFSPET